MPTIQEWIDCINLPPNKCNGYRVRRGLPLIDNAELPTAVQKSRGLGDTIAKFAHATGIAQAVEAVTNGNCGCKKRQEMLNELVPYK